MQDPYCSCGNGEQSADHILFYCSRFNKKRVNLIKVLKKQLSDNNINLDQVLCLENKIVTLALSVFLKKIGIDI